MTLSIMALTKMTLTITTLRIMIPSLLAVIIKVLLVGLRINDSSIMTLSISPLSTESRYAQSLYLECHVY